MGFSDMKKCFGVGSPLTPTPSTHHTEQPEHNIEDLGLGEEILSKFDAHDGLQEANDPECRDRRETGAQGKKRQEQRGRWEGMEIGRIRGGREMGRDRDGTGVDKDVVDKANYKALLGPLVKQRTPRTWAAPPGWHCLSSGQLCWLPAEGPAMGKVDRARSNTQDSATGPALTHRHPESAQDPPSPNNHAPPRFSL